jgi:hypothetical protein
MTTPAPESEINLGRNPRTDRVYYLCPDRKCTGFTDEQFRCRYGCPHKARRAVVCFQCKKVITVDPDCSSFLRLECSCGACLFTLMSDTSQRHNLPLKRRRCTPKVSSQL